MVMKLVAVVMKLVATVMKAGVAKCVQDSKIVPLEMAHGPSHTGEQFLAFYSQFTHLCSKTVSWLQQLGAVKMVVYPV